jgi:uncharacterized repeat protein (TIGR04076 family)
MAENYEVVASVISQKGTCAAGHCKGNEFIIGDITPAGMCTWAFYSLFPFYSVLKYSGSFPWEKNPDKCTAACPDAENPVVFELTRKKLN